ncbi:MAG TPA: putative metal-binding motif-containing protein [Thermoanaerobaculia bacterium]|nr:putative metal-binding motif-containing protein [Thermoanaerobaculia bacterium]
MYFSALCRLSAAIVMSLALAGPSLSATLPPLERSHDFRIPSPTDPQVRVTPLPMSSAKAFGDSERVSYLSFDGKTYELNRFHGKYVDLLLPDVWLGPQALSPELVRHFLDRTDMIYQYFRDQIGQEPAGDGPLPIAILPEVCASDGLGCSSIGIKGIEMADVPEYRALYWQEIAEDYPSGVLVHEMTHNFDVFGPYLWYVNDGAHGWTTFITTYYYTFTHEGDVNLTPEEGTEQWLSYASPYFDDPTATWASCIRDDQCEDRYITPRNVYGAFGLKIALRHGPQTVLGFTAFLRQYVQSHQPPATAEEKNDLYVEALAAGAHVNLSCEVDALRWSISDDLRQRMKQLYGTKNPACEDQDHDGYTPLQGDCNDHLASVHPGARELPNHLDDNCDGSVDERIYHNGGSIFTPQELALPAEVQGNMGSSTLDVNHFQLHLPASERIHLELCVKDPNASSNVAISPDVYGPDLLAVLYQYDGECSGQSLVIGAGDWYLDTFVDSETPLDYTMTVQKAAPWPLPPWARTAAPAAKGRQWILKAPMAIHPPAAPTAVRFWVSGQGYVGTVPYSRNASFVWSPPAGVDPGAEGLTYRAQLLAGGVPIYEVTPPQAFPAP